MVADLDISGTYPTEQIICNISRETASRELVKIEGLDERTQRSIGINLTGGFVNAVEICTRLYQAPTFDTLLSDYLTSLGQSAPAFGDTPTEWNDEGSMVATEEDADGEGDTAD